MLINHNHARAYWLAQQFLTRLPGPNVDAINRQDLPRSALYYPTVGLLIGCLLALLGWLLKTNPPLISAAIITAVWAAITGALHLDGLADSADAWLGGQGDIEKTHRILKDPLVGTAGVVVVGLILLLKFSALATLLERQQFGIIVFAPIIGRALILLLFISTDYVRKQGLASDITSGLDKSSSAVITVIVLLIAAFISLTSAIIVMLVFVGLHQMMVSRLKGCTGDTTGALVEISEMVWLIIAALVI